MTQELHFWIYTQKNGVGSWREFVHPCIAAKIHNSQKVEATQVYTDRQMYKKKWYKHTTEYYLALKEWNSDTCYYMDEP